MSSGEISAQIDADGKDDDTAEADGKTPSTGSSEDGHQIELHMQHLKEHVHVSNAFLAQQIETLQQQLEGESIKRQADINTMFAIIGTGKSELPQTAEGKGFIGLTFEQVTERLDVIEERMGISEAIRRAEAEQALGERRAAAREIVALRSEVEALRKSIILVLQQNSQANAELLDLVKFETLGALLPTADTTCNDEGLRKYATGDASNGAKSLSEQVYIHKLREAKENIAQLSNDMAAQSQAFRELNSAVRSLRESVIGHDAKYNKLASEMNKDCDATLARLSDHHIEENIISLGDLASILKPRVLRHILSLTSIDDPEEILVKPQPGNSTPSYSLAFEVAQALQGQAPQEDGGSCVESLQRPISDPAMQTNHPSKDPNVLQELEALQEEVRRIQLRQEANDELRKRAKQKELEGAQQGCALPSHFCSNIQIDKHHDAVSLKIQSIGAALSALGSQIDPIAAPLIPASSSINTLPSASP